MKRCSISVGCMTILAILIIASYPTAEKGVDNDDFLLENIEALTQVEIPIPDYPAGYNWSNLIDCKGWFTGDYQVCEVNGPKNACADPGAKTCDCGRNCN